MRLCNPVCPHDKTKTTANKIAKLGTGIVYHDTSTTNNIRSKVKVRVRVTRSSGVSYAPLSCASLVLNCIIKINDFHILL